MRHARFALAVSSVILTSCSAGITDDTQTGHQPLKTAVGQPAGDQATQVIGPEGGQLVSADGLVAIRVPAGALKSSQTVGIQPITAMAPSHVGKGYRFTPDGLTFAAPVDIVFAFGSDVGLANTIVNYGVAFQEPTGAWQWIPTVTRDAATRTITAHTSHFTDYGLVPGLVIVPADTTVKPGTSFEIVAAACYESTTGSATYYMLPCIRLTGLTSGFSATTPMIDAATWAVNGDRGGSATYGFVDGSVESATFNAPSEAPDRNLVAVSADYEIDGRRQGMVVANVLIEGICRGPSGAPGSFRAASIDCNGKWVGTASATVDDYATIRGLDISWSPDTSSTREHKSYSASGKVRFTPADPCMEVSPAEAEINSTNTHASLVVAFLPDSLTYLGQGGTEWEADVRNTCTGGSSHRLIVGGVWFAGGGTLPGSSIISGDKSAGGVSIKYEFRRQ
jgi:prepilin-type processing-associated H-X9-DG protein